MSPRNRRERPGAEQGHRHLVERRKAARRAKRQDEGSPAVHQAPAATAAPRAPSPPPSTASRLGSAGGGAPSACATRAGRVRRDDVILCFVDFTDAPGAHDTGLGGKVRPCRVEACHPDGSLSVQPLHGQDTHVARKHPERRIRQWRAAGLEKESYADVRRVRIEAAAVQRRLGRLSAEDSSRLEGG